MSGNAVGIDLDLDALITSVRKFAAERPDFVYAGRPNGVAHGPVCAYQRHGVPDCIVGHGFADIGIPMERIAEFDDDTEYSNSMLPYLLWEAFGLIHDYDHAEAAADLLFDGGPLLAEIDQRILWLSAVQQHQDAKKPWGQCVAEADAEFPLGVAA